MAREHLGGICLGLEETEFDQDAAHTIKLGNRWRQRMNGEAPAPAGQKRKRRRTKSLANLLAWETFLHKSFGVGFEHFVIDRNKPQFRDPFDWPVGSMVTDQASDCVCPQNFLLYECQCNFDALHDLSHGVHNDVKGMLKSMRLWSHTLLMIASYNLAHGTKYTPPRLCQLREVMDEYGKTMSPETCPIWQHFGPLIAEDFGNAFLIHDAEWVRSVWKSWLDFRCFATTGNKISTARRK